MVRGSCLCGGIQFEAEEVALLTHCHCSVCRKTSGAAFATWAHVAPAKFRFLKGEDLIHPGYEWTPGHARRFCKVCGSMAPAYVPHLSDVSIPAGMLDDDPGVRPCLHVFVRSKAPWWEITDDLPKYDKWVSGHEPKDLS